MTTIKQTVAPCLMQSAFIFENGRKAIFCTSESTGLSTFFCDDNFQPLDKYKPESRVAREHMTQWPTMLEYHKWLRNLRSADTFVKEHSTDIDNLPTVDVVINGTAGAASASAQTCI